jgi:hypothetical protein
MLISDEHSIPVDVQNEIKHKKESADYFRIPLPRISMRWIRLISASGMITLMRTPLEYDFLCIFHSKKKGSTYEQIMYMVTDMIAAKNSICKIMSELPVIKTVAV